MIGFSMTFPPVDELDLAEIEHTFEFRFPEDIRVFYLEHNGGKPEKNRFVEGKETYLVHGFLPIKHAARPFMTLEKSILWSKVQGSLLPEHLVPFAIDDFGNFFCFSVGEGDYGAIHFCPVDRRPSAAASKRLAGSLNQFLAGLTARPDRLGA